MTRPEPRRHRPLHGLGYTGRLTLLAWLAGLPGLVLGLALLWTSPRARDGPSDSRLPATTDVTGYLTRPDGDPQGATWRWMVTFVVTGFWIGTVWVLRERLVRPLQTVSNLLAALREGDYSFRARGAARDDALGEVLFEVNTLVETMRLQRLGALEATALLRTVMAEIEVAVFAFDAAERLRLVNRAGERLLAQPAERVTARPASELGLADCLDGDAPRTVQMSFPGASGRWRIQRQQFRQGGMPHQLVVVSDLSRELRAEERQAWQRLVRVLGHELNNSLAPVKSIAGSLESLLRREPLPPDWRSDMQDGLGVIANRAESLNRFVNAYAQLARLPRPSRQPVARGALLTRVVGLETRLEVARITSPEVSLFADPDQLEQALINLVRNAVDAVLERASTTANLPSAETAAATEPRPAALPSATPTAPPGVRLGWTIRGGDVEVQVEDDGPGLASTANLFVPFFTTKPRGSGIGLALSRQIAESHGGSLTLENRPDHTGCIARLRLPLASAPSAGGHG